MISAKTRGWLFIGLGAFFVVAAPYLIGGAVASNRPAMFQVVGGTLLLTTGGAYVFKPEAFGESLVTTILASAGFALGLLGGVGVFVL